MGRVLKAANWGLDRIIDGTGLLGIAIMIALSLFVATVMLSRHILAFNIPGFFDAAIYTLVIFPFVTAAFTLREGKHITVDFLVSRVSVKTQAVLRIITYLISLVFLFVLVWKGTEWASHVFTLNILSFGVWQVPQWILIGLIVFGAFLLIPQIIRLIAKDLQFLINDKTAGPIFTQGLLFVAGYIVGFAVAIYLFSEGNRVAATILLLVVNLFSGMPVFLALGVLGTVGLLFGVGSQVLMQVPQVIFNSLYNFPLTCLPLFVFAGIVMERGKLVDDLFRFVEVWIGHFTPSLLIVTIIVGMLISSLTGSTTAATAMLAATALPVLASRGFKKSLGCGLVAASASGALIPPSLGYVVYCVLVEQSIAEMFMASLIPAIILFSFFIVYILILNVVNKKSLFEGGQIPSQSTESVSFGQKLVLTGKALPILFAPVLVLGSIYLGIFTPTESAAALLLYSIILCVFVKRTLSLRNLYRACSHGAVTSSLLLCVLATAFVFTRLASQLRVNTDIMAFAESIGLGQVGVIVLMFVTLFIFGMFISGLAVKPITLPIFYPLAMAVGINPIWLCVFYQINTEMSTFTPPFGMDFFVMKSLLGISYEVVLKGVLPFILLFILSLVVIWVFPELALWLPSTMR